jgi:hypothetical protein
VSKSSPAESALQAARLLLAEPGIAPGEVAALLLRAERALGLSAEAELLALADPDGGEPGPEVSSRALRRRLRGHLRRLQQQASPRARWLSLSLRIAGVLLLLGGGLAVSLLGRARSEMGWRASYFPREHFLGEPVVQHDLEIAFRWKKGAPLPAFPRDNFSVRWESCLELDAPTTLALRLGVDDGGRLIIDGETLIDAWRVQSFHWDEVEKALPAGRYRVTVEYFEKTGAAGILLESHEKSLGGPLLSPRAFRLPPIDGDC